MMRKAKPMAKARCGMARPAAATPCSLCQTRLRGRPPSSRRLMARAMSVDKPPVASDSASAGHSCGCASASAHAAPSSAVGTSNANESSNGSAHSAPPMPTILNPRAIIAGLAGGPMSPTLSWRVSTPKVAGRRRAPNQPNTAAPTIKSGNGICNKAISTNAVTATPASAPFCSTFLPRRTAAAPTIAMTTIFNPENIPPTHGSWP